MTTGQLNNNVVGIIKVATGYQTTIVDLLMRPLSREDDRKLAGGELLHQAAGFQLEIPKEINAKKRAGKD